MPYHTGSKFTAIIADDHTIVRSGLRTALEEPGFLGIDGIEVIGEAENGLETIELVKTLRPDLLLLDISMPFASGAEILLDIQRWSPDTKIVVLTAVTSSGLLAGLVEAGVEGLFSKASDSAELFEKLPLILRGSKHVESKILTLLEQSPPLPDLTPRERQTLNMLVAGKTNAEIADLMGISPKTAEKHRASLMAKMQVRSLVELMSKALRENLIEQQNIL